MTASTCHAMAMLIVVRASRPKKLMWPVYTLTQTQTGLPSHTHRGQRGQTGGQQGTSLSLELPLISPSVCHVYCTMTFTWILVLAGVDTGGRNSYVLVYRTCTNATLTGTLRTTSVPSARARSPRLCTSTHRLRSIRSCFGSLCLISRVEPLSRADVERSDAMCPIQYARPNTFTHAFTESGRREIHRRPVGPAAGACH